MNDEIKRIAIYEGHYTKEKYPFESKPNFSTLGSIIEISTQGPIITFVPKDSIGNLLGFHKTTMFFEYNQSMNPVVILSFDNIFLETGFAQGKIFRGERSGIIHNFTLDVAPDYKYIEKFRGGVQWYLMETNDFFRVLVSK